MKKMKLAAVAAVLCLMIGTTAQAAGSSASGVGVDQTPVTASVTKADGTVVTAEVVPVLSSGSNSVSGETARDILGMSRYASYTVDVSLQTLDGEAVTLNEGSIDVTFRIPDVEPGTIVAVMHWADGSSEPESLSCHGGEGTITATFTSFSPVEILVGEGGSTPSQPSDSTPADTTAAGTATTGTVSPKTAEGYELYMAAAVAVVALAGAAVFTRKARS